MCNDEILAWVALIGNEPTDAEMIAFARAIESRTLTKQKAKWYQEGVEAGLRQATKREWVGLTHEDMEGMFLNTEGIRIARYIEAKIKEKNCG